MRKLKPEGVRLRGKYERPLRPGPKTYYPWDDWMKPDTTWLLRRKTDYRCTDASMRVLLHREAAKRRLVISIFTDPRGLVIVHRGKRRRS